MLLSLHFPLPHGISECAATLLLAASAISRSLGSGRPPAESVAASTQPARLPLVGALGEAAAISASVENSAQYLVERVTQLTGADAGFLIAPTANGFSVVASTNLSPEILPGSPVWPNADGKGSCLADQALRDGAIVVVADLLNDRAWRSSLHDFAGLRSLVLVPLHVAGASAGCLGLASAKPGHFAYSTLEALRQTAPILAAVLVRTTASSGSTPKTTRLDPHDRQRLELIAAIAHELHSPLASIKASTDILMELLPPSDQDTPHRLLHNIARNVERLNGLGSDLLEVARMRLDGFALQLEIVDLRTLVGDAVAAVVPTIRRPQKIVIQTDSAPVLARVDRRRFEQIVINLLTNASNFGGDAAEITVRATRRARASVVEIEDNGPGIPEHEQSLIFQPFYRGKAAAALPRSGSGLGLAIARQLAELHGGHLTVRSAVGRGSTFTITLPDEYHDTLNDGNRVTPPAAGTNRDHKPLRADSR